MTRTILTMFIGCLLAGMAPGAQEPRFPDDDAVRAMLRERIDTEKRNVGIVVGLVEPAGQRIVSYGTFGVNDARAVDGDTIFEIGSITKLFTSLLLADMVERGEARLDDPVSRYLPSTVKVPERDGKVITLQDLSTHTSGIQRLPSNMHPANMANPYADYSAAQLYEFLSGYSLPRAIGEQYEYSNVGVGILGHALSLRLGGDYERAISDRILTPLGMRDTAMTLTASQRTRLATGHNQARQPVANWDFQVLAGAGAFRSSVRDMLRFIDAFAGGRPHPLSGAGNRMFSVDRPGPLPNTRTALGWIVIKRPDSDVIWHDGGTAGYSSFIGYIPSRKAGVIVLSNMLFGGGVQDIGLHLLDDRIPLAKAPAPRTRISLTADALKAFVGRYELRPGFVASVTQEGERLFVQPTNQPRQEVFADTPRSFFMSVIDAQFVFEVDGTGRAVSMTLIQGGNRVTGKRMPE